MIFNLKLKPLSNNVSQSLSDTIKQHIVKRIYYALIATLLLLIMFAFYLYNNIINDVRNNVYVESNKLGDYIAGQYLVNNYEAINDKLNAFNKMHSYKAKWFNNKLYGNEQQDFAFKFNAFTYYYPIKIKNLDSSYFGYLILNGRISFREAFKSDLIPMTIIILVFVTFLYFLLIPLANQIPQKLILQPIKRILDIIEDEQNIANKIDSEKIVTFNEIKKIETQVREMLDSVANQSRNAIVGELSKKIVHDLRSPLAVLEACNNKINKMLVIDNKVKSTINMSIKNIRYILTNFLKINSDFSSQLSDNTNEQRYVLLKPILEEVLTFKMIEWHGKCHLIYEDNVAYDDLWIKSIPFELKNKIINLLNNAYESFGNRRDGKVIVRISQNDNFVFIEIIDNGCGMDITTLKKALLGYSTKQNGNGIGLSSSIDYFKLIDGELAIKSNVGHGTDIMIKLPIIKTPNWIASTIEVNKNIIILDDDSSIHTLFLSVFPDNDIKCFVDVEGFIDYVSKNSHFLDTTFFIDNFIKEDNKTGLELIETYNLSNLAYLMTSEYENYYIQEKASLLNLKLLPKPLISVYLKDLL